MIVFKEMNDYWAKMIQDKALRDSLSKFYSLFNFKKWRNSLVDYLETKKLAFHVYFRVKKPIKLTPAKDAVDR